MTHPEDPEQRRTWKREISWAAYKRELRRSKENDPSLMFRIYLCSAVTVVGLLWVAIVGD